MGETTDYGPEHVAEAFRAYPKLSQASWLNLVWFCFVVKNCMVGICLFGFDVPNLGCFRLV